MRKKISKQELSDDLKLVHAKLGGRTIILKDYLRHGRYGRNTFLRSYGSWNNALRENGLPLTRDPYRALYRQEISKKLRWMVLEQDGHRCVSCGCHARNPGIELQIDHIVPFSLGGLTEPRNLQTLCRDCNLGKKAREERPYFNLCRPTPQS